MSNFLIKINNYFHKRKMKNLLKLFDFYGTEFHWYFNYKPKYYTCYGGILSIVSFLCCIFASVYFGLDDFRRVHPISTISNIPPMVHKNIKFGNKKLYLPWRIMDYGDRFINHKGILYPRIYYFTNKYNSTTGLMDTFYDLLNYTLCNETSMRNLGSDFLIDLPLDSLFCIDMENLNMGGSWNSDFVNYIRLDLNLCKDGMNYNESNINCTKRDFLNSQFGENNNWFFQLLYPTVQFQPNNKTTPLLVLYTSYYYGLSTSSNKVDRVYLQEHIFEDERGWILDKITNITFWGVSSIKADHYAAGERDIFRYGSTSRLYSLKLYLDYGTVFYTRKYKKLFEILSEILPIIKGISAVFAFISEIINKLKVAKKINESIIGNEISLFKSNDWNEKNKKRSFNNLKFTVVKSNKSIADLNGGHTSKKKYFLNDLKDSSKLFCLSKKNNNNLILNTNKSSSNNKNSSNDNENSIKNSSNDNNNINFNHNNISFNDINNHTIIKIKKPKKNSMADILNSKPFNNTMNVCIANSDIFEIFNRKKPNFPLSYYFFGFFLNKISSKKYNNYLFISQRFNLAFTFYTHLIDISSYISLHQQFESLKKILIEESKPRILEIKENERNITKKINSKAYSKVFGGNRTFEH